MTVEQKLQRQEARVRSRLTLVKAFDQQPRTARIPGGVLDLLVGRSKATRWRLIAKGLLPRPGRDGSFNVGEVRDALNAMGSL